MSQGARLRRPRTTWIHPRDVLTKAKLQGRRTGEWLLGVRGQGSGSGVMTEGGKRDLLE